MLLNRVALAKGIRGSLERVGKQFAMQVSGPRAWWVAALTM